MAGLLKQIDEAKTGTPGWVVTFADMMGLLLCFFIMLVAMSEVKAEKFQRALESIQEAFGSTHAGAGAGPTTTRSIDEYLIAMASLRGSPENMGGAETVSLKGSEYLCRTTSEGLSVTFGAAKPFERDSAELNAETKKELDDLAFAVRGYTNRIIVRGHCSSDETGGAGTDAWGLSFARARAAADYLMSREIDAKRLAMESLASTQPETSNLSAHGRAENRRIEVVVTRQTVGSER